MNKLQLLQGAPNEIVMERVFDAPRALVVEAMTTPDLVKRWLGGVRAEVVSVAIDLRVGGAYRYVLRTHGGPSFGFGGTYREISAERIVQTESFDDYPGEALVTTTWTERAGRTTMRVVVAFASPQIRDLVIATGMADGAGESYDALAKLVER